MKTLSRRDWLFRSTGGLSLFGLGGLLLDSRLWARGVFAEELVRTPPQTEGPFYPTQLPLDTDNDLLIINDAITPAVGEVTHLSGRILDSRGQPIRNALVEIWQVDNNGAYLHSGSANHASRDKNFQGFGRFLTGSGGEYYFRTIKPVPYPGRPSPHIHVKVRKGGKDLLTTQFFIDGHPGNARDGVARGLRDPFERELLMVEFKPVRGSKIGELSAHFEIVLGVTPTEDAIETGAKSRRNP
jgi:protocatechuate 3,4-dioxygenase beta subunit